jgi:hypothetical protein
VEWKNEKPKYTSCILPVKKVMSPSGSRLNPASAGGRRFGTSGTDGLLAHALDGEEQADGGRPRSAKASPSCGWGRFSCGHLPGRANQW